MSKKSEKVRKVSIRTKFLIVGIIIITVVLGITSVINYNTTKKDIITMGQEEAMLVAEVVEKMVTPSEVEKISKLDEENAMESKIYKEIKKRLNPVLNTKSVEYLYFLKRDNGKLVYTLDTDDSEDFCEYGEDFGEGEELIINDGKRHSTELYPCEFGTCITAFIPVFNEKNEEVGLITTDFDGSVVEEQLNDVLKKSIITFVIGLIGSIVVFYIFATLISKGLMIVNDKIKELVSNEGDLTQTIDIKSGDEVELIAGNVNKLISFIRNIMIAISKDSNRLSDSNSSVVKNLSKSNENILDVSAIMEEMSASMQESSASLCKVSESMEDVDIKVKDVYERAKNGSDMAISIQKKADRIYDEAMEQREETKQKSSEMAKAVDEKIKRSKAVEEINMLTDNIINITDQTSLLALNASIEAARAGEAGRGFSVVASEIEKLAHNSAEAASKIRIVSEEVIESVSELAKESENLIGFMETTAIGGYERLLDISKDYRENANTFRQNMNDFAKGSKDLETITDSINESVSCINTAIEETTKGVVSVAETVSNLTEQMGDIDKKACTNSDISDELLNEVNRFKV